MSGLPSAQGLLGELLFRGYFGFAATIRQLPDRPPTSGILKEPHETKVHVEVLVAVKQRESRVVSHKIYIDTAKAFHQHGVFDDSRRLFPMDLGDLKPPSR